MAEPASAAMTPASVLLRAVAIRTNDQVGR